MNGEGYDLLQRNAFDALAELPEDYGDCAIVDYPWQFDHQNSNGEFVTASQDERKARDKRVPDIFEMEPDSRVPELLEELSRVLSNGAWCLLPADDRFQDTLREGVKGSDLIMRRNWVWTPKSMGMGYYGRINHYPIVAATNGDTDRYVTGRGTLYDIPGGRNTEYPTEKPVELYRQLLGSPVLREGDTLLEPFCGTAPGGAVAFERGIDYWGCDVADAAMERAEDRFTQSRIGQQTFANAGE